MTADWTGASVSAIPRPSTAAIASAKYPADLFICKVMSLLGL